MMPVQTHTCTLRTPENSLPFVPIKNDAAQDGAKRAVNGINSGVMEVRGFRKPFTRIVLRHHSPPPNVSPPCCGHSNFTLPMLCWVGTAKGSGLDGPLCDLEQGKGGKDTELESHYCMAFATLSVCDLALA